MTRDYAPSEAIVKTGLCQPPKHTPTPPELGRRGRWSPPVPQG